MSWTLMSMIPDHVTSQILKADYLRVGVTWKQSHWYKKIPPK